MRLSLCLFAAVLLSGCAIIDAPIRMHACSSLAMDQAGLRFDDPCWGGTALANAILVNE